MNKKVMVCVTQQKSCEELINIGYDLVNECGGELFVIHVIKNDWRYFGEMKESDALDYLFEVSKNFDAELMVYRSPEIEKTLAKYVKENKIDTIVMGESLERSNQQNMINRLKEKIDLQVDWKIISKKK